MEPAKFKAAQDKGLMEVEVELEEAKGKEGGLAAADALGERDADDVQESVNNSSSSSSSSSSKPTFWSTRFAAVSRQAWLVIFMYSPPVTRPFSAVTLCPCTAPCVLSPL